MTSRRAHIDILRSSPTVVDRSCPTTSNQISTTLGLEPIFLLKFDFISPRSKGLEIALPRLAYLPCEEQTTLGDSGMTLLEHGFRRLSSSAYYEDIHNTSQARKAIVLFLI
jgi:hypothetical protein